MNYQDDRIASSQGENVCTRNNTRARSFKLSLCIVNDFPTSQSAIRPSSFFSVWTIEEDRSVATLDKAVMKVHPQ
jgi:hypothetical protein